jgi:hypothetical protein
VLVQVEVEVRVIKGAAEQVVEVDEERMAEQEHLQRRTYLLLQLQMFPLTGLRLVQLNKCLTEWGIAVL